MTRNDPDNPDPEKIEELAKQEDRRQNGEKKRGPRNQQEQGSNFPAPADQKPIEDTVSQKIKELSFEYGTSKNALDENFEDIFADVIGYNSDIEEPELKGDIVEHEINEGMVRVEYVLEENLVDTTGEIKVPLIDADTTKDYREALSIAYNREDVDLDIKRDEKGNFVVWAEQRNPESTYQGLSDVARSLAEFEGELKRAYELDQSEDVGQDSWESGDIADALSKTPKYEDADRIEEDMLR